MVPVFEALFLLALDDDEGYIVESAVDNLEAALAGAVLAELALQQRIGLHENRVVVENQTPTGQPILDKALFDILAETQPRKLKYWANTLTYQKLLYEIGYDLVEQGVLYRQKKRLRLSGGSEDGRSVEASIKYSLKCRLREIVLAAGQPDLADKVLLASLYQAGLLKLVFTSGERKAARKQIKKLISGSADTGGMDETLAKIVVIACKGDAKSPSKA